MELSFKLINTQADKKSQKLVLSRVELSEKVVQIFYLKLQKKKEVNEGDLSDLFSSDEELETEVVYDTSGVSPPVLLSVTSNKKSEKVWRIKEAKPKVSETSACCSACWSSHSASQELPATSASSYSGRSSSKTSEESLKSGCSAHSSTSSNEVSDVPESTRRWVNQSQKYKNHWTNESPSPISEPTSERASTTSLFSCPSTSKVLVSLSESQPSLVSSSMSLSCSSLDSSASSNTTSVRSSKLDASLTTQGVTTIDECDESSQESVKGSESEAPHSVSSFSNRSLGSSSECPSPASSLAYKKKPFRISSSIASTRCSRSDSSSASKVSPSVVSSTGSSSRTYGSGSSSGTPSCSRLASALQPRSRKVVRAIPVAPQKKPQPSKVQQVPVRQKPSYNSSLTIKPLPGLKKSFSEIRSKLDTSCPTSFKPKVADSLTSKKAPWNFGVSSTQTDSKARNLPPTSTRRVPLNRRN